MSRGFGVPVAVLILTAAGCGEGSFSSTPPPVMEKLKGMEGDSLVMVRLSEGRAEDGQIHVDEECTVAATALSRMYGIKRKPRNEKLYVTVKDGRPVNDSGVFIDLKITLCESCFE